MTVTDVYTDVVRLLEEAQQLDSEADRLWRNRMIVADGYAAVAAHDQFRIWADERRQQARDLLNAR